MRLTALQIAMLRRRVIVVAAWVLAVTGLVFWILVSPGNPVTAYLSAPITVRDAQLIVGPYPKVDDFAVLKRNGVTTIVSLLDPRLPYERVLLKREASLAADDGLTLRDFPMGSIFDQRFGKDYDAQARAAAHAIATARGRVYLHSYLGLHRVAAVEAHLSRVRTTGSIVTPRRGEHTADADLVAHAQAAYEAGDFDLTLRYLFDVVDKSEASQILSGWADYRLGDIHQARDDFASSMRLSPGSEGALTGLGYCALREGDLDEALSRFGAALAKSPRDVSVLTGLGIARYRQGRTNEAAHYLRAALAIDPHDADARSALARI